MCNTLGTTCMKYDVEVHSSLGTLLELAFALFGTILKWSVGHGFLSSEVAQVVSPCRIRQKPSFCVSNSSIVCLWQDLWSTLMFLVVAHESLKWMVWAFGPIETALCHLRAFELSLGVEDTVPQKSGIQILTFPPAPKKNYIWWDFTRSAYTDESEIQVWWTAYPGVSENLIIQEMTECIIPDVLSSVVQLA